MLTVGFPASGFPRVGIAQQNFRRSQSKLLWWVILTRLKIPSLLIEAINNLGNLALI